MAMVDAMTRRDPLRTAMLSLAITSACNAEACGPGVLGELPETDGMDGSAGGSGSSSETAPSDTTGGDEVEWLEIQRTVNKDVDILIVVDDSASMGGHQARLAANAPSFIAVLEAEDVKANYRIAITTTDMGNPACATSAERGALVASSCRSRIADFVVDGEDVSQEACLDNCAYQGIVPIPTTTALDDVPRSRPWIESIEGTANFDTAVTTVEAMSCWLPQGIAGCRFTSPLEAAYQALERARDPGDPSYGFLRDTAHLFVVVLTDGSDCSSSPAGEAIFAASNVFWTDPSAAAPTPGVCWNAGVACSGASPGPAGTTVFGDCIAINKALDGSSTGGALAVLHPISRYVEQLEDLRAEREWLDLEVEMITIAGVLPGPDNGATFSTSADPQMQLEYGIGPSCVDGDGEGGLPPVRLRAVARTPYSGDTIADSICGNDYSAQLDALANVLREQIRPPCAPQCVADVDPSTVALDPDCEVRQRVPTPDGEEQSGVGPCLPDGALPDGVDVCWTALVDTTGATADPNDDASDDCRHEGSNLGVLLQRRVGYPARVGTVVEMRCEWSEQPEVDCPDVK